MTDYTALAASLGKLVTEKNAQYGDSAKSAAAIFAILYPAGIKLEQYQDILLMVRILDKLSRIAHSEAGKDGGGESPYRDIAGYALIGLGNWEDRQVDKAREDRPRNMKSGDCPCTFYSIGKQYPCIWSEGHSGNHCSMHNHVWITQTEHDS